MTGEELEEVESRFTAYHGLVMKHPWDYWIVLGTRTLDGRSKEQKKRTHIVYRSTLERSPRPSMGPITLESFRAWTPQQHFADATHPLHPRAKNREYTYQPYRPYVTWTAQELYDTHVPRLLRRLAKINQGPISYVACIERGEENGRAHAHMLLGDVSRIPPEKLTSIWQSLNGGRVEIRPFDRDKGESGYQYKHVAGKRPRFSKRNFNDEDVLWSANFWKPDRTHNQLGQGPRSVHSLQEKNPCDPNISSPSTKWREFSTFTTQRRGSPLKTLARSA